MKRIPLFLLLLCSFGIRAQFVDKKYYLIDSLELSTLGKPDLRKLDSLLKIYHHANSDSVRLLTIDKLAGLEDFNASSNYNKLLLAETKKVLSKNPGKANNKFLNQRLANALYNMNYYYSMINMEDSALKYLRLSIEPFRVCLDKEGLADAYNALGVYYDRVGNNKLSLKWFNNALSVCESINDSDGIARSYISIGVAYRNINEWDKALANCTKAIQIWETIGKVRTLPEAWNHIGIIYKWSGDTLKAKTAYEKSLTLAEAIHDDYFIATAKLNLGIIMADKKEYDAAIKNYTESLEGFKKVRSTNGMAFVMNSLALVYEAMNKPKEALVYAKKSYELAQQMGYGESLVNSSQVLSGIYEKLGMYKDAFKMQGYYFRTKDSLQGAEKQKEILKTQLEFESQKKLLGIKKEQEQKELLAQQERKQHVIIICFVVLCLLIVVVFAGFLFSRFRVIKKQKGIIEQQNHLVVEKNREILDSISYAKRLQEAILPPQSEVNAAFPESFIYYKPKDIVAGDFYWMHTSGSAGAPVTLFAAADSTGHGVPGALVSVVCSNALNRSVNEFALSDPGQVLDKTRELVLETFEKSEKDVKDGMDISLVAIQRLRDDKVAIKWAGANNPIWYITGNSLHEIKGNKQPVGKSERPHSFTTHTIQLVKGDCIYLFTDGFADQFGGEKGKKYKYKPLGDFLLKNSQLDMQQQKNLLQDEFDSWKANLEQVDDVCIAGIRI